MFLYDINILNSKNKKVYLDWNHFDELVKNFSEKILSFPNKNELCLLGVARGALPLLTAVSHHTEIRNISVVQTQITNSDNPFDYGNIRLLIDGIRDEYKKFIILEDIIATGETLTFLEKHLKTKGKEISSVFSLAIDENFSLRTKLTAPIYGGFKLPAEHWMVFPWERNIE